jgi:hypothetical protein
MEIAVSWFRRVDAFWFGKGSPVTLGLLRILLGLLVFGQLALTLGDFEAWFTEVGFFPTQLINRFLNYPSNLVFPGTPLQFSLPFTIPRFAPLNGVTSYQLTLAVYVGTMVLALLFTVGWRTRVVGILLALGLISIHYRAVLMIHGGDTLLRLAIIYLAFSQCGKALSLDRLRDLRTGKASAILEDVSLWPQRLIQYQVALCYFTTVWWKLQGVHWKDGTATWYPSVMDEFHRFPVPDLLERQPFVMLATYGTLFVELGLAVFPFIKPYRKTILIMGLLMHGYIEWHFNIPVFSYVITSMYIAFYHGDEISGWFQRLGAKLSRKMPWILNSDRSTAEVAALNTMGWPIFQERAPKTGKVELE